MLDNPGDSLAEGRDDALRDQVRHLGLVAADGQVGDGPGRLLLGLKLALAEVTDHHRHQPSLDHGLDLLLITRGDVGQEPDRLLITEVMLGHHVQMKSQDTLFIFSLEWLRRAGKCSRAPLLSTVWVWSSVPVTMLPTALRAAVCTFTSLKDEIISMSIGAILGHLPV